MAKIWKIYVFQFRVAIIKQHIHVGHQMVRPKKNWPRIQNKHHLKPINTYFIFQGCQKLYIRVPISLADINIQYVACRQMMGKLSTNNALLPELSDIFVKPFYTSKLNCGWVSYSCNKCTLFVLHGASSDLMGIRRGESLSGMLLSRQLNLKLWIWCRVNPAQKFQPTSFLHSALSISQKRLPLLHCRRKVVWRVR